MSDKQNELELLIGTMTLGLATALENNSINIDDAQMLLFSPRIMTLLEELGFSEKLVHLIHLGTELEDVKSHVSHKYEYYCHDLCEKARDYLSEKKGLKGSTYSLETLLKSLPSR